MPLWLAASEADLFFMFVQQTADLSEVESERVDIVTFAPGRYLDLETSVTLKFEAGHRADLQKRPGGGGGGGGGGVMCPL